MPESILSIKAPFDRAALATLPPNRVLAWYMKYATVFDADIHAASKQPTRFYASKAINYAPDGKINEGADAIWEDYLSLWGSFEKLTRDLRTIMFVTNEEEGTYRVHAECLTICHLKNDKGTVDVPTSFVYEIKQAEEGAGEDGLQIWEIRSYLDTAQLAKAKAQQEQ